MGWRLAVLALVALAACGGGSGAAAKQSPSTTSTSLVTTREVASSIATHAQPVRDAVNVSNDCLSSVCTATEVVRRAAAVGTQASLLRAALFDLSQVVPEARLPLGATLRATSNTIDAADAFVRCTNDSGLLSACRVEDQGFEATLSPLTSSLDGWRPFGA